MNEPIRAWWGRPPPRLHQEETGRKKWLGRTLILAILLMLTILLCVHLMNPSGALPAPREDLHTRIQMKGFELAVRSYWHRYREMPYGSSSNIIAVLAGGNDDRQNPDRIIYMKTRPAKVSMGRVVRPPDVNEYGEYLDGWGRPFEIVADTNAVRMIISSRGPDGVDDGGLGDDITMLIIPEI